MANAKNLLLEIARELTGDKYKGMMFPLTPLHNFQPSATREKVKGGGYGYSVNALMFLSAALADLAIDMFEVDGEKFQVRVEDALRDPEEQFRIYDEHQKKCDRYLGLDRTRIINPRVKPGPHTTGSAIDVIRFGDRHLHTKDLTKKDIYKKGVLTTEDWQNDEWKAAFADTHYVNFSGNKEWEAAILDQARKDIRLQMKVAREPMDSEQFEAAALKKAAEVSRAAWKTQIHFCTHIELTDAGWKNADLVAALANNRILTQIGASMPFISPINSEYWHWQTTRFLYHMPLDFPMLYEVDYEKQDFVKIGELSAEIMSMAEAIKGEPIYQQTKIIPGQRIEKFSEESMGSTAPIGSISYMLAEIDETIRWRDKALEKSAHRQQ